MLRMSENIEKLCDILFELSNEDRLLILLRLLEEPSNLTNLSKKLNLTTQEASRHVSRLTEVNLTRRDTEGLIHVNPVGRLLLIQMRDMELVSRHLEYFNLHRTEHLPIEFTSRLGELTNATYIDDVMVVLHNMENVIVEAEEYIWSMTDQYPSNAYSLFADAMERGVVLYAIEREGYSAPPQILDDIPEKVRETIVRLRSKGFAVDRLLPDIDVHIFMNEKEVASVAFPLHSGRFDYLGFTSKDPQVHNWCHDVYEHYWETARPRTEYFIT
jgi:predicted transcriptional regulator